MNVFHLKGDIFSILKQGTDTVTKCINAHCGPVAKVILGKDGKTLVSIGMHDGSVRVWRVAL